MIFWGVICIIFAFAALSFQVLPAMIFWAALGSVLIALGMSRRKEERSRRQTIIVNNYTTPPARPAARASVVVGGGFPVAGVTFTNDDGSSRQEILRSLCGWKATGCVEAVLEEYDYKGSPAIWVKTALGCVGNIRRTDVETVLGELAAGGQEITLQISIFENDEGRELYRGDVFID